MRLKMKLAALAAGTTMLAAYSAGATISVYTSQADFLAALSAQGEDTFNSLPKTLGTTVSRSAGAFDYTVSSLSGLAPVRTGTTSDSYLTGAVTNDSLLFYDFSDGANAIGGDFFQVNTKGAYAARAAGMFLVAVDQDDNYDIETIASPTVGSFLGFISTVPLYELEVELNNPNQARNFFPTVNNLYLGAAVSAAPEPAAWALMLIGFGGAGGLLRRRRAEPAQSIRV